MHYKKIVSILLSTALIVTSGMVPKATGKASVINTVISGAYAESGSDGAEINYTYYKGGKGLQTAADGNTSVLIIEGNGGLPGFSDNAVDSGQEQYDGQPWFRHAQDTGEDGTGTGPDNTLVTIPKIIIGENVSGLGNYAFYYAYDQTESIYLGKSVKTLSKGCLGYISGLENIYIYGELDSVDQGICQDSTWFQPVAIHVSSENSKKKIEEAIQNDSSINAMYKEKVTVTADLTIDTTPLLIAVEKGKIEQRVHTPGTGYTTGSWNALVEAIEAGEAVLEGESLTEEIVTEKALAIDNARNSLVSSGELDEAIAAAEQLQESDYTPDTWQVLKTAVETGKADGANATADEITALARAINEAISNLQPYTVDEAKADMDQIVTEANKLVESDYTVDSWKVLQDAVNESKTITESSIVSEVVAVTQRIVDAIDALVVKYAVSSSLGEIYTGGKAVKVASGTANAEMAGAVKAKVFFDTTEQTCYNPFASIDLSCRIGAKEAWKQFVGTDGSYALGVKHWDETLEIPEITEGSSYEFSVSTKAWESLKTPIYTIQLIELYDAEDNLLYTIEPEKITDKLAAAIKKAESKLEAFEAGDYTSGDTAVKDAITAAKELMEKEGCLQSELDQMIAGLDTAMTALVPADTTDAKKTMSETVTEAEGLKESDYTADSWKVLQDALANAKALSEDALLSEVKAADKAVQDAVKALVKADTTPTPPPVVPTKKPSSPSPAPNDKDESDSKILKKGSAFTAGTLKYKVTNAVKGKTAVTVTAPKSKKVKGVTIPATVKKDGVTYKVTSISANAFKQCKKLKKVTIGKNVTSIGKNAFFKAAALKKITVKSTKLKSVGKKALKGINKKAVIKVPKAKYKKYKKMFKGKGQSKSVKIKK